MIVGTMTGECYKFVYDVFRDPLSTVEYIGIIGAAFKKESLSIFAEYPPDLAASDQRELLTKVCTRWIFSCGSRYFLENAQHWYKRKPTQAFQYAFDFPLDIAGWYI